MNDCYIDGANELYNDFLEQQKMETSKYRKLTEAELIGLGFNINQITQIIKTLMNLYNQFFDKSITPCKALIMYDSEYNDSTYDNQLLAILFYDASGNELVPIASQSARFRRVVSNDLPIKDFGFSYETESPLHDMSVTLSIPELYIKE